MAGKKSIPALTKFLADVKKTWFTSMCVLQSVFIVFYLLSIFNNTDKLFFLITYSILLCLSIITFVTFLLTNVMHVKKNKRFNRAKNFTKYAVNSIMLMVKMIEMLKYGLNDFNKILLFASAIILVVQILIEFIKISIEKYITNLKTSIKDDFEKLNLKRYKKSPLDAQANLCEQDSINNYVISNDNPQKEQEELPKTQSDIKSRLKSIFNKTTNNVE